MTSAARYATPIRRVVALPLRYEPCDARTVPSRVRFDASTHAPWSTVAYGGLERVGRHRFGAPYRRATLPDGSELFSRLATVERGAQ